MITSLYNGYLQYGVYGYKGEVKISSILDSNDELSKPISISAAGDGTAFIKVDGNVVLSVDATGKLSTNGYNASSNNNLITKVVTDGLKTLIDALDVRVTNIENTSDITVYANGTLSTGTDGRYNVDPSTIYLATTSNVTLSGSQSSAAMDGVTTLADGVYILVKSQTNQKQNGIYQYSSNSQWNRVNDYLSPNSLKGKLFNVINGINNGKKMFYLPRVNFTDGSDFGTDDIIFSEYIGAILPASNRLIMRDSNGCAKVAEPNQANDAATKNYVDPVVISTDSNNNVKVVTGAPALKANMSIKFFFTTTMTGTDTTTGMKISYNGTAIDLKAVKNGALVDLLAHEVAASDYRYIQAYTTIEVIYNGGYFVVVGNPVVLSSSDYTIYADGYIRYADENKLSDWDTITMSTDSNNPTTMQYDGYYSILGGGTSTTSYNEFYIYVNGTRIGQQGMQYGRYTITIPFKKGDKIYIGNYSYDVSQYVAYYKNRDYSNR